MVPEKSAQEAGFTIEELDEKTADECTDTMIKAMPQVKWNKEGLRRSLLAPNALTLIARREAFIVGVISGTVYQTLFPPPMIGLNVIFEKMSGERGLGGYLIDEFIGGVQKKNPKVQFLDVSVPSVDTGSIALYSLKGFLVEGFVKHGFSPNFSAQESQDLVILRRYIATTPSSNVV